MRAGELLDAAEAALQAKEYDEAQALLHRYREAGPADPESDEHARKIQATVNRFSGQFLIHSKFATDPDDLYQDGSVTFFWSQRDGLVHDDYPKTHCGILETAGYPGRFGTLKDHPEVLLGRYAPPEWASDGAGMVAYWNKDPDQVRELLPESLRALVDRFRIPPYTAVLTPVTGKSTVADVLSRRTTARKLDAGEENRWEELAGRAHLARGVEKRAIMRQLGRAGGGGKPNEWNRALRAGGRLAPGHDYWRMSSESKQRRLAGALSSLGG